MIEDYTVSTNKELLDVDIIYNYLCNDSYWATGRSRETVVKSINNSLCFGLYKKKKLIGFARVVTDYSVFAWILDVFIIEDFRNQGLGKRLMDDIINHPQLRNLQRWGLATKDAHGLYEKYGFKLIQSPDLFMEKTSKPS